MWILPLITVKGPVVDVIPSRMFPLLVGFAAALAIFAMASKADAIVTPLPSSDSTLLGVRNDDGDWWVSTTCKSSGNNTLGPGYVYKLIRNNENPPRVYVDDYLKPIIISYAGRSYFDQNGGLGSFSWHHARGGSPPGYFWLSDGQPAWGPVNAWPLSSRVCAGNYPGAYNLFGVASSTVTEQPGIQSDGLYGYGITVDMRTPWQNPIIRLVYTYRFYDSVVKVWIRTTTFCGPVCGDGHWDYAKEPKFVAETDPASGFARMRTYRENNLGWTQDEYIGAFFPPWTEQVEDNARARALFVRQQTGSIVCDNTTPCLNVVARSYPAGSTLHLATGRWEQNVITKGLDFWASVAHDIGCGTETQPHCANPVDSYHENCPEPPNGCIGWPCNGGDPAGQLQRRWELAGNGYTPFGFVALFHGWEGGAGNYDCEPLSRRFPGPGWEFSTQLQFSINDGWDTD